MAGATDTPLDSHPYDTLPEYAGNPLIEACGPIRSPAKVGSDLLVLPYEAEPVRKLPTHLRSHALAGLSRLYVPSSTGIELAMKIDVMIRQSYVFRSPNKASTWATMYGSQQISASPICAAAIGGSGNGKTVTVMRALSAYPQVVVHESFPHLAGKLRQLLWLQVSVPPSGKQRDFAEQWMRQMDLALGENRFEEEFTRTLGPPLWAACIQRARNHFLGMLFIDEMQNFFRLDSVRSRSAALAKGQLAGLRVAEDTALRALVDLVNEGKFAVLVAGTPDGMEAFSKRFASGQRLSLDGLTKFDRIITADEPFFANYLFPTLHKFSLADSPPEAPKELRKLLHAQTCGVPRILVACWKFTHDAMWKRGGDRIVEADIRTVMNTHLSPLQAPLDALRSDDPRKLSLYEDLLPKNFNYFSNVS